MLFSAPTMLPRGTERGSYLRDVLSFCDEAARSTADEVLASFFGHPVDPRTLRVTGLHHVAVYVGDYEREEDFDAWLALVRDLPGAKGVSSGPSHIAPREYGTPGHWINFTVDGLEVELFSCRHRGKWAERPVAEKNSLMSHFGLSVDAPDHVRPLLDFLASFEGVSLLAHAPADELGHTYGHLVRHDTGRVLELVHAGAPSGEGRR